MPARAPGAPSRLLGASRPDGRVGAAIPFGVAGKLARPDAPVVIGDGAFPLRAWELHTAFPFRAPVIVVVGNDAAWGMERHLQPAFYEGASGVGLGPLRYHLAGEARGALGLHVTEPAALRPAVERAVGAGTVAGVNGIVRGVASPQTLGNITRHRHTG